jgi:hypothetical protein
LIVFNRIAKLSTFESPPLSAKAVSDEFREAAVVV